MAGTLGMKVTHGVDQGIIQMVLYRISEEMKCTWGFKEDIERVRGQLIRLEEQLQGVAEIGDNVLINQWLKKVKNVAYEADNLLDEYAYEAFNRRLLQKYQTELTLKIRFYFSSSNPAVFRIKMALRDGNLMNSVDEICKDAIDLGIKPIRVASGYTYDNPGSDKSHELKESRLQNREQWVTDGLIKNIFQIDHITKLLCDPSNTKRDLTIIGIVGLSGIFEAV
ncbi:putative disease resistance protein RGA1 isoform X2 [Silene latifolia]|uniref:putative disease resistance protein RGA1 isoform X2 n=1 Tax=Silene latifolia TaxID=37657 RepID=UPI003D783192